MVRRTPDRDRVITITVAIKRINDGDARRDVRFQHHSGIFFHAEFTVNGMNRSGK